jgi:serine/threonine-protein kinase
MNEEPRPPSEVASQTIPAELDAILLRCLAKRPEDRFEEMAALAEALEGVDFDPPWTSERARDWWLGHAAEIDA